MSEPYDSAPDTAAHIEQVQRLLMEVQRELAERGARHDLSKLREPEKSMFDTYTPRLRAMTYNSDEYKRCLAEMRETALAHHYEHNDHHPEHHERGIDGMSLLSVLEMLADWRAATMRHADGSLAKSLEINRVRFGIGDQLHSILLNTARELRWLE